METVLPPTNVPGVGFLLTGWHQVLEIVVALLDGVPSLLLGLRMRLSPSFSVTLTHLA